MLLFFVPHLFFFALLPPFVLLNFTLYFVVVIHKQVKHMNVFCLWDLFGHDVNLYYFLNNFLPMNLHYLQTNLLGKMFSHKIYFFFAFFLSVMRNVCMIFHMMMMMRKDFFPLLSNSIIEHFCRIFCMKIVCYYYCIIFVYQQQ